MPQYTQITLDERRKIECWLLDPQMTYAEIGRRLCRPRQTISREVRRHGGPDAYKAASAQKRVKAARSKAGRSRMRLLTRVVMFFILEALLKAKFSPVLIARWFKENGMPISHETIYQFIYWDRRVRKGKLWQYLRHARRSRKSRPGNAEEHRGKLPNARHISERPEAAEQRLEIGHGEADTVYGPGTSCLLTLADRKSRLLFARVLPDRKADTIRKGLASIVGEARRHGILLKSLTLDNGKEFAMHELFAKHFSEGVFFGDTYSPWQRGLIEERNRALRWYFPKGTDFSKITSRQLADACLRINNRPMACLGYRTPWQVIQTA